MAAHPAIALNVHFHRAPTAILALVTNVTHSAERSRRCNRSGSDSPGFRRLIARVSVSKIIKALPTLSETERRAAREVLVVIANENPDIALCSAPALEGALMLDRLRFGI